MLSFPAKNVRISSRDNAGVAAIEFALVLPLLLALVIGVIEITRFVITNQKIDNASTSIANVISDLNSSDIELNNSTYAQIEQNALPKLLGQYNNEARLQVVMVQKNAAGENFVSYSYPAGIETPPNLSSISLSGRETVINSSITMEYRPLLPGLNIPGFGEVIQGGNLTKSAFFRTRSSLRDGISPDFELDLTRVSVDFPPPECNNCYCDASCKPENPGNPDSETQPDPEPEPEGPSEPQPCTGCDCPGQPACQPPTYPDIPRPPG